ncbi:Pinin, partial [Stegodyphus mimosarum]
MLGMILGTLQKFQHEEKKRKQQDLKRAEIEQKVEAAAAEEKERIKREKEELFHTRREKQTQLRCLEKKLEIAEMHETWENNQKYTLNFLKTKANPPIFFLPASHNPASKKGLEESKANTLELIKQQREKVEKELQEVEEWYKKDNFPSDKENIGPQEECEPHDGPDAEQQERSILDTEGPSVEERTNENNVEILADQDFEPIYD